MDAFPMLEQCFNRQYAGLSLKEKISLQEVDFSFMRFVKDAAGRNAEYPIWSMATSDSYLYLMTIKID